ncbi:MAG: hypothetical protein U5N26_04955 [Candidatus Marinimicrobia bacterium]|nr:hypothetical protein [Candidatus Neomarinimicrobiota bacterium]
MKKACVLFVSVLLLLSCSTTRYTHYEYDRYFQNTEPYTYVDDPEDAARYIARKIARQFHRSEYRTIAVLNFTDEYGDPLNRGMYFADDVAFALSRYRNPVVVKRETLYEMVRERQLFHRDLIRERGYMASRLVHADYVLTGRIIRGEWDEMVSVRCFRDRYGARGLCRHPPCRISGRSHDPASGVPPSVPSFLPGPVGRKAVKA